MTDKKTLIICCSMHHGNTLKVAKEMAVQLKADILTPEEVSAENMSSYGLIGFGSGIYDGKHHKSMFDLVNKLKPSNKKKAFVFSTNTFGIKMLHKPFIEKLNEKGFVVDREFACKGFMDFSFTKYLFGGINKGRPDKNDLAKAREFAKALKN